MNSENLLSEVSPQQTPTVFPLTELGKQPGQWTLTLHPSHLALSESPGTQPYILLRDAIMKSAVLLEGMRTLTIKEPVKVTFKLSDEATKALASWIGESTLAAHYLKQRYSFVLPIAVLWIVGSLSVPGGSSTNALPTDYIGLCLGFSLLITWAWAKWRPDPILFLVDSVWCVALAVNLIVDVMYGRSKGWLVLILFMFWMVVSGVKYFIRFRGVSIPSQKK